jgi:hypothetical protein
MKCQIESAYYICALWMVYVSMINMQHKIWNNTLGFDVAQIHNKPVAWQLVNTKQIQYRAV